MSSFDALGEEFWSRFVADHWEQKPILLKGLLEPAPFSPELIFETARAAAKSWGRADTELPPILYRGVDRVEWGQFDYLPTDDEQDAKSWVARLADSNDTTDFVLYCKETQSHDVRVMKIARAFLGNLLDRIGPVVGQAEADLFIGNYKVLPFGVHRHVNANFMFGVMGTRRLRVWSPETYPQGIPVADYMADRDAIDAKSTAYDVEPGDLLYWPAGWWHIGECPTGLSMSANINVWKTRSPLSDVLDTATGAWTKLVGLLTEREVAQSWSDVSLPRGGPVESPPESWQRALGELLGLTAARGQVENALLEKWLTRSSGLGFNRLSPRLKRLQLADDDRLRLADRPILWSRSGRDYLVVSGWGHARHWPAAGLEPLLETLNDGERHRLGDLLDRLPAEVDRVAVRQAVVEIASWQALERVA